MLKYKGLKVIFTLLVISSILITAACGGKANKSAPTNKPEVTLPMKVTLPPDIQKTASPHAPSAASATPAVTSPVFIEPINKSGTAMSDTGTALNLRADWIATKNADDDSLLFSVSLYLICYSINVSARDNGIITINNDTMRFRTEDFHITGGELNTILFTTYEIRIPVSELSAGIKLEAKWCFNGRYSGNPVDTIVIDELIAVI